jgi:hypothetical protein
MTTRATSDGRVRLVLAIDRLRDATDSPAAGARSHSTASRRNGKAAQQRSVGDILLSHRSEQLGLSGDGRPSCCVAHAVWTPTRV